MDIYTYTARTHILFNIPFLCRNMLNKIYVCKSYLMMYTFKTTSFQTNKHLAQFFSLHKWFSTWHDVFAPSMLSILNKNVTRIKLSNYLVHITSQFHRTNPFTSQFNPSISWAYATHPNIPFILFLIILSYLYRMKPLPNLILKQTQRVYTSQWRICDKKINDVYVRPIASCRCFCRRHRVAYHFRTDYSTLSLSSHRFYVGGRWCRLKQVMFRNANLAEKISASRKSFFKWNSNSFSHCSISSYNNAKNQNPIMRQCKCKYKSKIVCEK